MSSYIGCKRDTARICCRAPCCGAAAAGRPPPGPQQQTRRTPPLGCGARKDRQTERRTPYRYTDPAAYQKDLYLLRQVGK